MPKVFCHSYYEQNEKAKKESSCCCCRKSCKDMHSQLLPLSLQLQHLHLHLHLHRYWHWYWHSHWHYLAESRRGLQQSRTTKQKYYYLYWLYCSEYCCCCWNKQCQPHSSNGPQPQTSRRIQDVDMKYRYRKTDYIFKIDQYAYAQDRKKRAYAGSNDDMIMV